jgi:hypothetical protein
VVECLSARARGITADGDADITAAATDTDSTDVAAINGARSLATDSLDVVLARASMVVRCAVEADSAAAPMVAVGSTVVADPTAVAAVPTAVADPTVAAVHTAAATVVDTGNKVSG